jgi:hypothetical protein
MDDYYNHGRRNNDRRNGDIGYNDRRYDDRRNDDIRYNDRRTNDIRNDDIRYDDRRDNRNIDQNRSLGHPNDYNNNRLGSSGPSRYTETRPSDRFTVGQINEGYQDTNFVRNKSPHAPRDRLSPDNRDFDRRQSNYKSSSQMPSDIMRCDYCDRILQDGLYN